MKNVKLERLELKYCEHCGGIWLRKNGERHLYCQRCRPIVVNIGPRPGGRLDKEREAVEIGE